MKALYGFYLILQHHYNTTLCSPMARRTDSVYKMASLYPEVKDVHQYIELMIKDEISLLLWLLTGRMKDTFGTSHTANLFATPPSAHPPEWTELLPGGSPMIMMTRKDHITFISQMDQVLPEMIFQSEFHWPCFHVLLLSDDSRVAAIAPRDDDCKMEVHVPSFRCWLQLHRYRVTWLSIEDACTSWSKKLSLLGDSTFHFAFY